MKTLLLFFIFIIISILDIAAQSKDTVIVIIKKNHKTSHAIPCNEKYLSLRIGKHTLLSTCFVKEWGIDSFKILYKKDYYYLKSTRVEKDSATLSRDTLYTIAYSDITGIRQNKRTGSFIEKIVIPITALVLVGAIVSGDPEAFIFVGVVTGIFVLQATIFPYDKLYRFDKKWKLVSIAGHRME